PLSTTVAKIAMPFSESMPVPPCGRLRLGKNHRKKREKACPAGEIVGSRKNTDAYGSEASVS
ncbi:UNVERIFIED_CONTAM: hypothetical protein QO022_44050, partial [Pseudomonas aeruginosa]